MSVLNRFNSIPSSVGKNYGHMLQRAGRAPKLAWEQRKETEGDTKFVELGGYLCEVRAGQYWRLEDLKSFELDFL